MDCWSSGFVDPRRRSASEAQEGSPKAPPVPNKSPMPNPAKAEVEPDPKLERSDKSLYSACIHWILAASPGVLAWLMAWLKTSPKPRALPPKALKKDP